jgi:hypothetical protein
MCHSTENMYRFADTAVARVSDDFYPRDAASSTPHIAACAFNSVYMGALVQPDWDMFQVGGGGGGVCLWVQTELTLRVERGSSSRRRTANR